MGIAAKNKLISSEMFSKNTFYTEYFKIYRQIKAEGFDTTDKKVIRYLPRTGNRKYRRTNLHAAVIEGNLEKTYCIVEFHKKYHGHSITFDINIRDTHGKTVLDYARNNLLIAYLEENNAKHSIHFSSD